MWLDVTQQFTTFDVFADLQIIPEKNHPRFLYQQEQAKQLL